MIKWPILRAYDLLLPGNVRLLPAATGQLSYPYWEMSDNNEQEKDKCPIINFS